MKAVTEAGVPSSDENEVNDLMSTPMKLINESLTRSHSSLQYSLNVQDGHVQNLDGRAPFSPPISNPGIGDKSDQSLL